MTVASDGSPVEHDAVLLASMRVFADAAELEAALAEVGLRLDCRLDREAGLWFVAVSMSQGRAPSDAERCSRTPVGLRRGERPPEHEPEVGVEPGPILEGEVSALARPRKGVRERPDQ
jgi:hypothetical protein